MGGGGAARRAGVVCVLVVVAWFGWSRYGAAEKSSPWAAPVDVSAAPLGAAAPQVGVDERGDAVAVWQGYTRRGLLVQSAVRAAGESWRRPVDVSSGSRNARYPELAVGAQGTAIAVWRGDRLADDSKAVFAAVRERGRGWQRPTRLSAPSGAADDPQVVVDRQGNAIALWTAHRGLGPTRLHSSVRPRGGRWEAPVDVAALSTASHAGFADPRLAVDAHGNAVAVWTNVTGNDWGNQGIVQSAARPVGGGWESAVDVSTAGHKSFAAHVALDARGNAVVVFNDHSDDRGRSAMRPAGGAWTEPVDISDDESAYPQVGVDADGDAVAVWMNSERRLCAARADVRALGSWRSRDCIAIDDEVRTMKATVSPQGNAAAVWMTGEGGDSVKAALLPAGDDWHAPITISPPQPVGEATGAEAAITIDRRGTAIAIWGREVRVGDDHDTVVQAAVHGPP